MLADGKPGRGRRKLVAGFGLVKASIIVLSTKGTDGNFVESVVE